MAPARDASAERRPLHVGICAPYDLGEAGGVNSHIRAQAAALRARGHRVTVFGASSSPLPDGEIPLGSCVSIVLDGTKTGFGVDPRAWFDVRRLFDRHAFDVVHMHEPFMPLVSWFVMRRCRVPIVATFHTHREAGHRWYARFRPWLRPMMQRVTTRLAVSEAARRTVAREFPGRYEIVPNGIDVGRFQRACAAPSSMVGGRPHVLFVGRLERRKGADLLVRAMSSVQRRLPEARLVLVGEGPERSALERLARELAVDATFEGRVTEEELPAYYRAADVVCSPARGGESFGVVLLEAMAAGRPLVATRIDGYAELLNDAACATLVDVDDPAAIADAIGSLLANPDLSRTLGVRAASHATAYDWPIVARRLEDIYRRAVSLVITNVAPSSRERDRVGASRAI
jgi:phosphatidylinositol alpha-mannosyltransferase